MNDPFSDITGDTNNNDPFNDIVSAKEQQGLVADAIDFAQMGAIGGAADIAQGITGGSENFASKGLRDWADNQLETISDAGKQSAQDTGFNDDLSIKENSSARGVLNLLAQGAGSFAPSMLPGGLIGKGLNVAGKVNKLGKTAQAAAKTRNAMIGHGVGGAAMIGGSTANQAIEEVRNAPLEQLANSDDFVNLFMEGMDSGLSHPESLKQAREGYAQQQAEKAFVPGAAIGGISMGIGNPVLEKVIAGKVGISRLANAGAGAATEGIQEFGEGFGQKVASNKIAQDFDTERDTYEGAVGEGATGAVIGAGLGGGLGVATYRKGIDEQIQESKKPASDIAPDNSIDVSESNILLNKAKLSDKLDAVSELLPEERVSRATEIKQELKSLLPVLKGNAAIESALKKDITALSLIELGKAKDNKQSAIALLSLEDKLLTDTQTAKAFKDSPDVYEKIIKVIDLQKQEATDPKPIWETPAFERKLIEALPQTEESKQRNFIDQASALIKSTKFNDPELGAAMEAAFQSGAITPDNIGEFERDAVDAMPKGMPVESYLNKDKPVELINKTQDAEFKRRPEKETQLINKKPDARFKPRPEQLVQELEQVKNISDDESLNKVLTTEINLIKKGKNREALSTRLQNPKDRITKRLNEEQIQQVTSLIEQESTDLNIKVSDTESKATHEDDTGEQYTSLGNGDYQDASGEVWAFDEGELSPITQDYTGLQESTPITQNESLTTPEQQGQSQNEQSSQTKNEASQEEIGTQSGAELNEVGNKAQDVTESKTTSAQENEPSIEATGAVDNQNSSKKYIADNADQLTKDLAHAAGLKKYRNKNGSIDTIKIREDIGKKHNLKMTGWGDADVIIGSALLPMNELNSKSSGRDFGDKGQKIGEALRKALGNDSAEQKEGLNGTGIESNTESNYLATSAEIDSNTISKLNNAVKAAEYIETKSSDSVYKEIAGKIKGLLSDKTAVKASGITGRGVNGTITKGNYATKLDKDFINIHLEGQNESTLLHELTHAATAKRIREERNTPSNKKLSALIKEIDDTAAYLSYAKTKANLTKDEKDALYAGLRNADEFLTHTFTNSDFQSALKKIPAKTGGKKNLFETLSALVKDILGLNNMSESAFNRAIDLSFSTIDEISNEASQKATTQGTDTGTDTSGTSSPATNNDKQPAVQGEEKVSGADNYVKKESTNTLTEQDHGTRGNEQDNVNDGGKDNQPRVSASKPRPHDGSGNKNSSGGLPEGQGLDDANISSDSKRNGLPRDTELVGHKTDGKSKRNVGDETSTDGNVSGASRSDNDGSNNLSLINKPNIALTPAKRRDVNNLAEEILKKPVNEITAADKEVLRQYTGSGGLNLKDSVDKGAGIFNQHYTDYTTIKSMYSALQDAGIKIKKALEPSVGSGNFIGMLPNADWSAVDIDATNTEVVKRLYPDAKVSNESYETFNGKNFDLIISNVPFASFSSLPRAHAATVKPAFKAIHNFFFAQSVDKLKTNGVMAFMTSTGTMDGVGEAQRLRKHLTDKMDVIGVFRLPMGTQKANASTEVMIDVVFLQKRPDGVESKQPEKNESFVNVASKDGHKINKYFIDYPDSVLGDLSIGKNKTSMGKVGWIVTGDADYSKMKLEKQDYTTTKKADKSQFKDVAEAKQYADDNGLVFELYKSEPYFSDGIFYDTVISYSDIEGHGVFGYKLKGINADKLALLDKIDNKHDAKLVDEYKNKYEKSPHKDKQLKAWAKSKKADKILNSYLSLFDEDFNLSEIFTEQVRFKDSGKIEVTKDSPLVDRAESLEDVDGVLSAKDDLLSADDIQSLLDDGSYARLGETKLQNSRLYYAGNIYKKLDELSRVKPAAQRIKQENKLDDAKPELIPIDHITITGKEAWLPPSAKSSLGEEKLYDGTILLGSNAIEDRALLDLFNKYINGEPLVKKHKDDTEEEHNSKIKTAQATLNDEVIPLIKQKLLDDGLKDEVVDAYNSIKNFFAAPIFDGSSLKNLPETFRGKDFKLMQHQQEGAERAIYNKKGVLAFAPGLGKTPTAIIVADQLLQKGVIKKPLFIVPANTIPQWEETARELYPNAKIFEFPRYKSGPNKGKVKDWVAMNAADKEKMVNDLTNSRYDYTFISTNLAQKFTIPKSQHYKYISELTESLIGLEVDDESLTKSQIKAKEARVAKVELLRNTMISAYKDDAQTGFDMGKLGFDGIFADEVQYYKNIGMQSADAKGGIGANVALNLKYPKGKDGKPDTKANPIAITLGSSRSYDFRFKTRYISENNNGNNVFLLTGTPTPNKPLELMTLLHHLDTKILDEYGVDNVSDFVSEFLEVSEVEEMNLAGEAKMNSQLTAIKNIDALKKIITRYVDYRSPESAKDLKRPKQIDKVHVLRMSDTMAEIFDDIKARLLQAIEDGKQLMQGNKIEDAEVMIQMYSAGRDASIDVRLYKPTSKSTLFTEGDLFKEESSADYSKIAKTVELVADKAAENPDAGQIIFLDRLKFAGNNGSTHSNIRDKILNATGLKPEQVVYVNGGEHVNPATGTVVKSGPKPERLQAIIEAYNKGDIKVIIGNTSKLGVGVDLQVNTTDIYQIDKPYRPDEIEQRNNRGVRQGNKNAEVTVHTFNQPGTFDDMSDRIIANKQGFNDVFWKDQNNDTADVSTEGAPSAYDAAIELEQDPDKKKVLEVKRDLEFASRKTNNIEKLISNLAKRLRSAKQKKLELEIANKSIDDRPTPEYKDKEGAERKKALSDFKKRMKTQREKNVTRIADIEEELKILDGDREARRNELSEHKDHIKSLRDKYVVDGVVSIDKIKSSPKFSKSNNKSGSTVEKIRELLPKRVNKLVDAGKLKIVQSHKEGDAQAFYDEDTDTVTLIADNLNTGNLNSVLSHELYHRAEVTDKKLQSSLSALDKKLSNKFDQASEGVGTKAEKDAYQRVIDAETNEADQLAEFKAYLVEAYEQNPKSLSASMIKWVKDLISTVRAALIRQGLLPKNIMPADLSALAKYGAKVDKDNENLLTSKAPKYSKASEAISNIKESEVADHIKTAVGRTKSGAQAQSFGLLTLRQIADLTKEVLPEIKGRYVKNVHAMDTEKNKRLSDAGEIATDWAKLDKKISNEMSDLMHDSTIAGVDGAEHYVKAIDIDEANDKIKAIQEKIRGRAGDNKASMFREIEELRMMIAFEKKRKVAYPEIKARFNKLAKKSSDAASIYRKSRNHHEKHFEDTLEALKQRIGDSEASPEVKKNLIAALRLKFESLQAQAPYFPLARFGDYWVQTENGDDTAFNMFESEAEQEVFKQQMRQDGVNILGSGKQLENLSEVDGVSAEFITEVDTLISGLGDVPMVNDLRDSVYQLYLNSLPDVSARKHFIHRKKTKGFHQDQLRAFAKKSLHDANSLAKLKFGHKLQETLTESKEVIDIASSKIKRAKAEKLIEWINEYLNADMSMDDINTDLSNSTDEDETAMLLQFKKWKKSYSDAAINELADKTERLLELARNIKPDQRTFAVNALDELRKSYKDMMNPKVHPLAQKLNSVGFAWFLGLTPAAAMVNLTQTPVVSLPILASKVGWGKASKYMLEATKIFGKNMHLKKKKGDSLINGLSIKGELKGDELQAFNDWIDSGLLDVTLAHDLAGLSDEGILTNTGKHKIMNVLSFGFHHAERMNREITALASYRAGKEKGMNHNEAVQFAADLVLDSHFDYTSSNRARFMRGNVARVVTQFKQYSQNLTYLYARTIQQAYKGSTPEEKAEAKKALRGMLIMQFSVAGTLGMPMAGVAMGMAQVLSDVFGDDDEFDDVEGDYRQLLADLVTDITGSQDTGNKFSHVMSKGFVDAFTPFSVSGRLSASDLWVRGSNRELERESKMWDWAKTILGPMSGLLIENPVRAMGYLADGHNERALETMMPKAIKDSMKALRYSIDGVENLRGDKIKEDYSIAEGVGQLMGFASSEISEVYAQNNAISRVKMKRDKRRSSLLSAAANARIDKDISEFQSIWDEIKAFNKNNPNRKILMKNVIQSIKGKNRRSKNTENGMYIPKRNRDIANKYQFSN